MRVQDVQDFDGSLYQAIIDSIRQNAPSEAVVQPILNRINPQELDEAMESLRDAVQKDTLKLSVLRDFMNTKLRVEALAKASNYVPPNQKAATPIPSLPELTASMLTDGLRQQFANLLATHTTNEHVKTSLASLLEDPGLSAVKSSAEKFVQAKMADPSLLRELHLFEFAARTQLESSPAQNPCAEVGVDSRTIEQAKADGDVQIVGDVPTGREMLTEPGHDGSPAASEPAHPGPTPAPEPDLPVVTATQTPPTNQPVSAEDLQESHAAVATDVVTEIRGPYWPWKKKCLAWEVHNVLTSYEGQSSKDAMVVTLKAAGVELTEKKLDEFLKAYRKGWVPFHTLEVDETQPDGPFFKIKEIPPVQSAPAE